MANLVKMCWISLWIESSFLYFYSYMLFYIVHCLQVHLFIFAHIYMKLVHHVNFAIVLQSLVTIKLFVTVRHFD